GLKDTETRNCKTRQGATQANGKRSSGSLSTWLRAASEPRQLPSSTGLPQDGRPFLSPGFSLNRLGAAPDPPRPPCGGVVPGEARLPFVVRESAPREGGLPPIRCFSESLRGKVLLVDPGRAVLPLPLRGPRKRRCRDRRASGESVSDPALPPASPS